MVNVDELVALCNRLEASLTAGTAAKIGLLDALLVEDLDDTVLNTGNEQRLILVAANFRKEVTATILWLIGHGVRAQCFRVVPYSSRRSQVSALNLSRTRAGENKWFFDRLDRERQEIEDRFGPELDWQRLDDKKASRICYQRPFDGFDGANWPEMIEWLCKYIVKLEETFSEPLGRLNEQMKSGGDASIT